MHGVMKNIRHLTTRDRSRTWGPDAWKKVVVCIVSDGRSKINPKTLNVLAAMGVYQDGVAKNIVNDKAVTAHIYEVQNHPPPPLLLDVAIDGEAEPNRRNIFFQQ